LTDEILAGPDDISLYLLKICVAFKLKPFLGLVSASIREGISPATLRNTVKPE
jgi:hypothetical protein